MLVSIQMLLFIYPPVTMYTQYWGSANWIAQAKLDLEKHKESKLALMLAAGKNQGPMSEDQQAEYISKLRTEASKPSASELTDEKEPDSKGNGFFMIYWFSGA